LEGKVTVLLVGKDIGVVGIADQGQKAVRDLTVVLFQAVVLRS